MPEDVSSSQPAAPAPFLPLPFVSLGDLVRDRARAFGDRPAFSVCLETAMSATLDFAAVDRLSDAFAAFLLHRLGLEAGTRVALQMPNTLAYPVCAFGTFKAGCVVVNANPLYTAVETRRQLADSGARVLVVVDLVAGPLAEAALDGTAVETVVVASLADFFPAPQNAGLRAALAPRLPPLPTGAIALEAAIAEGEALIAAGQPAGRPTAPDDTAVLQYTGGTTGIAKGAELTHANLLANLAQVYDAARSRLDPAGEVALTVLPLYHITAFSALMLLAWHVGGHNVLVPDPRPVAKLRPAFERFPITMFAAVNVLMQGLLREEWFRAAPPRQLRWTLSGSTALHPEVAEAWHALVGSHVYEGYGLSETAPVVTLNRLDVPPRIGTIGQPVAGTEVRIVDDEGRDLGPGAAGELWVKGPQVMRGYWNRPDETAAFLRDGWFATGDVAVREADGYLRIVDRKKDMIDVNGFNVYPNEVEVALNAHPAVMECAVVGVRAKGGGETVRAYVVLSDDTVTEDDLRAWCAGRLTRYKVPKEIIARDSLPKSPVGKILRRDLRAQAAPPD